MTNSDKISEVLNKCKDMLTMKVDDFEAKYYPKAGLPTIIHEIDEALKLLSSPAIVGVEPAAWMTEDGRLASVQAKAFMPTAANEAFTIPLYLSAQAPQSSPAPSVIEAGDALYKCIQVLKHQPDWFRDALDAWDAAKASRPSVTAPVMSREQLKEKATIWLDNYYANRHRDGLLSCADQLVAFALHVLSLSPAAQGVMPQVDKIMEVVVDWAEDVLIEVDGVRKWTMKKEDDDLRSRLSALLKEK